MPPSPLLSLTETPKYVCKREGCAAGFASFAQLQRHEKEKHPFACSVCGLVCRDSYGVRQHEAIHARAVRCPPPRTMSMHALVLSWSPCRCFPVHNSCA